MMLSVYLHCSGKEAKGGGSPWKNQSGALIESISFLIA
ncbi:hypothetical protein SD77_4442 [Bacillus badius]|uniref:Uncharacterized protein n=1 Tax=Bacillus badius TaxID=1455 RepID=A0ABR5AVH6_BACBA|nr:hypothetical protein SD78_0748 [Bacillus badius]KIL78762.1 hypothetical protein SD77_4442 [Bacillus badius]